MYTITMYKTNNTEYKYESSSKDGFSIILFVFIIMFAFGCVLCTSCMFYEPENLNETTNEIEHESLPIYYPRLPSYKSRKNSIILIDPIS